MKLYITRHGQTDWNYNNIIQGKSDIALNAAGRSQAMRIAQQLADIKIDMIFSSPLIRALETAQIINRYHSLAIICDQRIEERGFGNFEGSDLRQFNFADFWNIEKEAMFPDCEKTSVFFHRVYDFIEECKKKYDDKTILVVAHGGVSLPFYTYVHGIVNDHDMRKYMLKNCEVADYEL